MLLYLLKPDRRTARLLQICLGTLTIGYSTAFFSVGRAGDCW